MQRAILGNRPTERQVIVGRENILRRGAVAAHSAAVKSNCQGELRPDPVFIIGMHRSGTSALGGVLAALGLSVGRSVMPPSAEKGNPKGYYENLALVNLHDQFLSEIGWHWMKPFPVPARCFQNRCVARYREEILRLMVQEFGAERPLIKDPRLCQLVPLWRPLIESRFPEAKFLLVVRSPLEVAHSLCKRDSLNLNHGLALWAVHVFEGERESRAWRREFMSYEQLLAAPADTAAAMARELALPVDKVSSAVAEQLDPGLRHSAAAVWPKNHPHQGLLLSIYDTVVRHGPEMASRVDELRERYYREMALKM